MEGLRAQAARSAAVARASGGQCRWAAQWGSAGSAAPAARVWTRVRRAVCGPVPWSGNTGWQASRTARVTVSGPPGGRGPARSSAPVVRASRTVSRRGRSARGPLVPPARAVPAGGTVINVLFCQGSWGRRAQANEPLGSPKLLSLHAAYPLVVVIPPVSGTGVPQVFGCRRSCRSGGARCAGRAGPRRPARAPGRDVADTPQALSAAARTCTALRRSSSWSMSLRRRAGVGLPSVRQASPRWRVWSSTKRSGKA